MTNVSFPTPYPPTHSVQTTPLKDIPSTDEKPWVSRNWFFHASHTVSTSIIETIKWVASKIWNLFKRLFCCYNPLRSFETLLRQPAETAAQWFIHDPKGTIQLVVDAFTTDFAKAEKILDNHLENLAHILGELEKIKCEEYVGQAVIGKTGQELERARADALQAFKDYYANKYKDLHLLSQFLTGDREALLEIFSETFTALSGLGNAKGVKKLATVYFGYGKLTEKVEELFKRHALIPNNEGNTPENTPYTPEPAARLYSLFASPATTSSLGSTPSQSHSYPASPYSTPLWATHSLGSPGSAPASSDSAFNTPPYSTPYQVDSALGSPRGPSAGPGSNAVSRNLFDDVDDR